MRQKPLPRPEDDDFLLAHRYFGLNTLALGLGEYATVSINRRLGDAEIAAICRWVYEQPNPPEELRWARSPKGLTEKSPFTTFMLSKAAQTLAFGVKMKFG